MELIFPKLEPMIADTEEVEILVEIMDDNIVAIMIKPPIIYLLKVAVRGSQPKSYAWIYIGQLPRLSTEDEDRVVSVFEFRLCLSVCLFVPWCHQIF